MDRVEASGITVILSGDNYDLWSESMKSFLIGKKLWRYVTGDFTVPVRPVGTPTTPPTTKEIDDYRMAIDDWDSKNHTILTWIRNTSSRNIQIQLRRMDTAKKAWDYLENRFQATGGMHHYQLLSSLHALKHESGQSIDDFFSTIQSLWDRIDEANIDEEQLRVIQLLMKLGPEYESVRGSLLHRDPLPSLDIAMKEISFEATRFAMLRSPTTDSALAVPSSVPTFSSQGCSIG
ncbi:uncharacterized protein LOC141815501 [Curcuma longa]|uniref:uncharacterized protein LOC141815501 n=2 Tax=Curcuma longa TaxID=136217 RepID=UPI003D9E422D